MFTKLARGTVAVAVALVGVSQIGVGAAKADVNSVSLLSVPISASQSYESDGVYEPVSADGQWAVFASRKPVVPGTDESWQVYARNTSTGTVEVISAADGSTQPGDWDAGNPGPEQVTPDGRYVAFEAGPHADGTGAAPVQQVFIRDTLTDHTELVSVSNDGAAGNAASWPAAVSDDGRYVLFTSLADNLKPDDVNGNCSGAQCGRDVFLRDRLTGTTTPINPMPEGGSYSSTGLLMSGDGRYLLFAQSMTNALPAGDFELDRTTGNLTAISPSTSDPTPIWMSQDGQSIRFICNDANTAVCGPTPPPNGTGNQVFQRDVSSGAMTQISLATDPSLPSPSISGGMFSRNGRYALFQSPDSTIAGPTLGYWNVYAHDSVTGATIRVTNGSDGNPPNGQSYPGGISDSGQVVTLDTYATNIVAGNPSDAAVLAEISWLNNQTLTFGSIPNQTYGASPVIATATASSQLPVSYTSGTPPTCTIDQTGTVTLIAAGTCAITASQAGDSNYTAAPDVTQTFTVSPAPLTLTANAQTTIYGSPIPPLTASLSGFVNGDSAASATTGAPSCTTTASVNSPVGLYPIACAIGTLAAANYTVTTFVPNVLTVSAATTTTTWPTPAPITFGTALSATQLDATASVPGTFTYTPGLGATLAAGSHTLNATFNPTDATDYTTVSANVTLQVAKATPSITWATPAPISFGTALSASQLDAVASVPGTFSYSPGLGATLAAGSHTLNVTFTPSDTADYTAASASVTLQVTKATPLLTWATPNAILYGTPLSATQLDAHSTIAGTFSYTPQAGAVLQPGTQTLTASFTPTDTADYNAASISTQLTVGFSQTCITTTKTGPFTIAAGQSICLGVGGKIVGPVTVAGALWINGGSITGPVTIAAGGQLWANAGSITGSFSSTSASALTICATQVTGALTVAGSRGAVLIGGASCPGNTITGPVNIAGGTGGLVFSGNKVTGPVLIENNSGGFQYTGNTVTGPVTLIANS